MARFIDADEFVKRVIQYPRQSTKTIGLALADTPTADVVPVVRCIDCVHYNAGFECLKEGYGIEHPPDYYCADGERKEGDAE